MLFSVSEIRSEDGLLHALSKTLLKCKRRNIKKIHLRRPEIAKFAFHLLQLNWPRAFINALSNERKQLFTVDNLKYSTYT